MNILLEKTTNIGNIINNIKENTPERIKESLESLDQKIFEYIDNKRYRSIGFRSRRLMTSVGSVLFKRRYYKDLLDEKMIYLLDNNIELPKYERISEELRFKIINYASTNSYRETGENVIEREGEYLTKSTICRIISDSYIEEILPIIKRKEGDIVHVQIDEKFIGIYNLKNKRRYYTATIFTDKELVGKERYKLINKTVLSSKDLNGLRTKIANNLAYRYQVKYNELVFVSGDFATYIRGICDDLENICSPTYVPDKFHVKNALNILFNKNFKDTEMIKSNFNKMVLSKINKETPINIKGLKGVIKYNPDCFTYYLDPTYKGCSQEGMNSKIYAPRFGKYANRFKKETIEKLSLIRESKINNSMVRIKSKKNLENLFFKVDLNPHYLN